MQETNKSCKNGKCGLGKKRIADKKRKHVTFKAVKLTTKKGRTLYI